MRWVTTLPGCTIGRRDWMLASSFFSPLYCLAFMPPFFEPGAVSADGVAPGLRAASGGTS